MVGKISDKKTSLDESVRKNISEGIIKSMSGFVEAFSQSQKRLSTELNININQARRDLSKVFKSKIDDSELLPNLMNFKDYLEKSGESIEQFGKSANLTVEQVKSLEDSISALDKTSKEMDIKESKLRQAGLVTEREIVNGKLRLKVLTDSEIREKQKDIITKRKQIDDEEKKIIKLSKQKDEQGRISQETQDEIEKTTKLVEELNKDIKKIKEKGVKEVQKVLTGFSGAIAGTYSRFRAKTDAILDAFLPEPVAQVFKNMIQTVETVVSQVMDLMKPITATIGAMIKAPRFIAKNLFGKTDKEFDEMRANFIEKTKQFLMSSVRIAHEGVTNLGNYLGGKFLQSVRFVGKIFTAIGFAVKGIMLALLPFKLKILVIVGILALIGVALFMFGKKIYEVGVKIAEGVKGLFKKIGNALKPIIDPVVKAFTAIKDTIMSIVDFFREKLDFLKPTERQKERKRELQEHMKKYNNKVSEKDAYGGGKYTQEEIRAKQASGEFGKIHMRMAEYAPDEKFARDGLIDEIMENTKVKGVSRSSLEKMSTGELMQAADRLIPAGQGLNFMLPHRNSFAREMGITQSQKEEDEFMKRSKIMVDGQEKSMYDLAYDNTEKGLQLKARLENNKQYKEFMKQKAEFDARQKEIGGMTNQQAINNLTSTQSVTAVSKLPTRNAYAPYTDANAMSYSF